MGTHPLALTDGLTRRQIEHGVEHAAATIAIGNGPTLILILGYDADRMLIEATGIIRDEDVLFVHAAPARPEYDTLLEIAEGLPGAGVVGPPTGNEVGHGWSVDGLALTDTLLAELIERAGRGHDLETLKIRIRPGRPAPLSIGDVVRVELEPSLFDACAARADLDKVPVHEVIRRALRREVELATAP